MITLTALDAEIDAALADLEPVPFLPRHTDTGMFRVDVTYDTTLDYFVKDWREHGRYATNAEAQEVVIACRAEDTEPRLYRVVDIAEVEAQAEAARKAQADWDNSPEGRDCAANASYWSDRARASKPENLKGETLRVYKGRKVPVGTVGVCIWYGEGNYGTRVGIKDSEGTVHWTARTNVQRVGVRD